MVGASSSPDGTITPALEEWVAELGEGNVLADAEECRKVATATFHTEQSVPAVLSPASRIQVQACLRIANKFRIPLYAYSSGRNWGFGSKVPVTDGSVLLDLGRMNRILRFSEENAYIVLEPGVSFGDVHRHLTSKNSALYLPMGGGPEEGSLMGNTLERGEGAGAFGNRIDQITGMEVVLPTGEFMTLGYDAFAGSSVSHSSLRTPGPDPSGLFAQSNLGVVTAISVGLPTRPATMAVVTGGIRPKNALGGVIDGLRTLTRNGVLSPHSSFLWSGLKLRSVIETSAENSSSIRLGQEPEDLPAWHLCCQQAAPSSSHASATRSMLTAELTPLLDTVQIPSEDNCRKLAMLLGDPSANNARSVYHCMPFPVPDKLNPDLDGCGVRWVTAILPFHGDAVVEVIQHLEGVFQKHGILCNMAITNASDRRLHLFAAIVYDRTLDGRDFAAAACQDELSASLLRAGCLPYRLGIQSMTSMPAQEGELQGFLRKLKNLCDPFSILAPGRYE